LQVFSSNFINAAFIVASSFCLRVFKERKNEKMKKEKPERSAGAVQ